MNPRPLFALVLSLVCLLAAGCSTFERRAEKKSATFNALDTATQVRLKAGQLQVGDTEDMVFISLGKPDEQRQRTTPEAQTVTWVYNNYWQEYRGEAIVGSRRVEVRNKSGGVSYYYEPIRQPVYETRQQERLRVTFAGGKISVIEQAK